MNGADGGSGAGRLGAVCSDDSDCASDYGCYDGHCLCRPGLTACSYDECVDVWTHPKNCGGCDNECLPGEVCKIGECVLPGPPPGNGPSVQAASVSGAVRVDATPQTDCRWPSEGYPERTAFTVRNSAQYFMPYAVHPQVDQHNPYNWGSNWDTWSATSGALTSPYPLTRGDSWATSSPLTRLNYASQIVVADNSGTSPNTCIGIAASTPGDLVSGTWTYPLNCVSPPTNTDDDGPSIHIDQAGTALYAVDRVALGTFLKLYIMPQCSGQPGSATCPVTREVVVHNELYDGSLAGHATVVVNPCTHHALVAYRTGSPNYHIILKVYDSDGNLLSPFPAVEDLQVIMPVGGCGSDPNCGNYFGCVPKCGGPDTTDCSGPPNQQFAGCMRVVSKVHLATYVDGNNKCYAYLAYDKAGPATDGQYHIHAALRIYDVTEDAFPFSPSIKGVYESNGSLNQACYSNGCSGNSATNEFESVVSVNSGTGGVGWFFYKDTNPCFASFTGYTATVPIPDPIVAPFTNAGNISGKLFPIIRWGNDSHHAHEGTPYGLGDYVGIVKGVIPGGYLLPSWVMPVDTAPPCNTCQGANLSMGIFVARVLP